MMCNCIFKKIIYNFLNSRDHNYYQHIVDSNHYQIGLSVPAPYSSH